MPVTPFHMVDFPRADIRGGGWWWVNAKETGSGDIDIDPQAVSALFPVLVTRPIMIIAIRSPTQMC
jgi:hypothetical protein